MERQRKLEDYRFGLLCSLVGNAAGGKGKGRGTFHPSDFFPSLKEDIKPPSARALNAWADMMNAIQNAKASLSPQ
ncbi:MAG TPA: hypothetical protein VGK36_08830 [Candidatus Angelobacter sp.]|jgi:hypothetical protein